MKRLMIIAILLGFAILIAGCKSDPSPEEPYNPYSCGGNLPNVAGNWTFHIYDQTSTEVATINLNIATQDALGNLYGAGTITMASIVYPVDMNKVREPGNYGGIGWTGNNYDPYVMLKIGFDTDGGPTRAILIAGVNCQGNAVVRNIVSTYWGDAYSGVFIKTPVNDGDPAGHPTFGSSSQYYWFDGTKN